MEWRHSGFKHHIVKICTCQNDKFTGNKKQLKKNKKMMMKKKKD